MEAQDKKEEKKPKIEHVEGGKSINRLIDEANEVYEKFYKDFKGPIDKKRTDVMKVCLFTKTKGANIKHCYMGSLLAMCAAVPSITVDSLKKQVTILDKSPYVKIKVIDQWEPTFEALESWVDLYV
jgi:hypothetical protein